MPECAIPPLQGPPNLEYLTDLKTYLNSCSAYVHSNLRCGTLGHLPLTAPPRIICSTIRHHLCCVHKSWVHSSTLNTPPGSRRHLSPHTRTRLKYPRLENIHWHRQGLQAETPESSAGSVLPHTQEKIHSIRRSNMPHSDNSHPQQIRETHQPRHRQNWQANEEPN